jgi:hypothetical protein
VKNASASSTKWILVLPVVSRSMLFKSATDRSSIL